MIEASEQADTAYPTSTGAVKQIPPTPDKQAATAYDGAVTNTPALTPQQALGKRLRAMREAAGLSQKELAEGLCERLGEWGDQTKVSRVERGDYRMELHEIEAWTSACGAPARMDWTAADDSFRVTVPPARHEDIARLLALGDADFDLLVRAAPFLETAPTARRRLAFEIEMWTDERHAAQIQAAVATAAANISGLLQGRDAEALALLQHRVGLTPPATVRKKANSQK